MKNINKVTLLGTVVDTPEIKIFNGDRKMAKFTLVTNKHYKNNNDEWEQIASFHRCITFNSYVVDDLENKVNKGDLLMIDGTIKYNIYEKNGEKKYSTEIIIEDWNGYNYIGRLAKKEGGGDYVQQNSNYSGNNQQSTNKSSKSYDDDDEIRIEDIPF